MSSSKRKRCDHLSESNKKAALDPTLRSITPQMWYNVEAIADEGFELVKELLDIQGWSFLVSVQFGKMANGYDTEIVHQFYSNLKVATNETSLSTKVFNKSITVTHSDITLFFSTLGTDASNLTVENAGLKLKFRENGGTFPNFTPETDIKNLLQPCFVDVLQPTASHLKVHNRLLLHILYNTVIPRKGSLTYIPKLVFAILHYINAKIKINYSILIMGHMLNVSQHASSTLPYATLITYWLKNAHKIKSKSPPICTYQTYDDLTLHHMFQYDSTTSTWTTKTAPKFSQPSDRSLSTNETPTFTTPPAIPHTDSHLISPASASSSVKHSSSSIPVLPYTPTAPGYSPFSQQPDPSQPSSSQPPIAPLMADIIDKLNDLKLNTTSTSMFNSASEQLFTMIRDFQTSSTMTLRRIEDKVDAFEDKMKGYGHHSYDCMQSILNAQQDMVDTQRNMKQLQLALLQEFAGQFPKASSPAAKPTSSKRGFK